MHAKELLLAALLLTGCGSGDATSGPSGGPPTGMDSGAGGPMDAPVRVSDSSGDTASNPADSAPTADVVTTQDSSSPDAATYDILNQPSASSSFFYPTGLVSQTLPNSGGGGPTAHLMPNSDAVIAVLLSETASGGVGVQPATGSGGFLTGSFASPGSDDGGQIPLYFGRASDVVYKPINVKHCGPLFETMAQRNSSGIITNLTFHAPAGALYSGQGGGDDNTIAIWDTSGEGISAGKVLGFYTCCGGATTLPACPGVGADGMMHQGTAADPCTMNAQGAAYCSYADPVGGSGFGGGSAADGSNDTGPYSAWTRYLELVFGHVQHAMDWNTNCEATAGGAEPNVVFPATGFGETGYGALKCTDQSALAPPNGSLYFLDYTDAQLDCLNPAKPACNGADGKPITKLDALHFIFIEQLAHYGGYESDTGGPASTPGGLGFYHVEASESYAYYEAHGYPGALTGTCPECFGTFQNLWNAHCSGSYLDPTNWCYANKRQPPDSAFAWETRMFYNLPFTFPGPTCSNSQAAAGQCGVGKHLHIADPCVPVAMSGMSSASGGGKTWTACP